MTEKLKGISGSMFAGKTELLIKEITRAKYAGKKVQVFKPAIDTRWGADHIHSHSGSNYEAVALDDVLDLLAFLEPDTDIVAIDEIQFFDDRIVDIVRLLLDLDIRVIFSGLSLDFRGEPFGPMPELLVLCDELEHPTAICDHSLPDGKVCGGSATRTQRLINGEPAKYNDPIVLIGASDSYAARCPNHHLVPGKPESILKRKN